MGIVGKLLDALTKQYQWDPRGIYWGTEEHHPVTDPQQLRENDLVEYAIEWPDGIVYQILAIHPEEGTATIEVVQGSIFKNEKYTTALHMLRPVQKKEQNQ